MIDLFRCFSSTRKDLKWKTWCERGENKKKPEEKLLQLFLPHRTKWGTWGPNPFLRKGKTKLEKKHENLIKENKALNQDILKTGFRLPGEFLLPLSLSRLYFSFVARALLPRTEAQPCKCQSPVQTTTWRGAMGTTASRAPPAPTWWTKPGPSSVPWPSSHAASARSPRATSLWRSQRGNTLAWSTGVCVLRCIMCVFHQSPACVCIISRVHYLSLLCCSYFCLSSFSHLLQLHYLSYCSIFRHKISCSHVYGFKSNFIPLLCTSFTPFVIESLRR